MCLLISCRISAFFRAWAGKELIEETIRLYQKSFKEHKEWPVLPSLLHAFSHTASPSRELQDVNAT